jgi:ferredoxin-NADP reductase/predicted pyridoxine 5'-phosphate oxidase superfamily flavin-nucleotide-binding protein
MMRAGTSPFHRGEQIIQSRLGVRDQIEPWARKVVREYLPAEHRAFYAGLPFVVAAARDAAGRPWATVLEGEPGFASSPDPGILRISATPATGDALAEGFEPGADIGLLGIELHTRRRNRLNGRIDHRDGSGFELAVGQAFGNCPQHIHERVWRTDLPSTAPLRRAHTALTGALRQRIDTADTFFIASGHRGEGESSAFGMDVSHRGGDPGFVRVLDERTLLFPDYAGNNHFNTIGNLLLDPRAGLLFVDFSTGDLLQLTGRATVEWDHPDSSLFPGAQRLIRFDLEAAIELRSALALRWDEPAEPARRFRIAKRIRESEDVVSFVLDPVDGEIPLPFHAGQHLPIEAQLPGRTQRTLRTYSLSGAQSGPRYRITVKREAHGEISRHLHDSVREGDELHARQPSGDFVLQPPTERGVVLLSAGVGVTPMVSMLHGLVEQERRSGSAIPISFLHVARDGRHHPLAQEIRRLIEQAGDARLHVAYTRPRDADVAGRDYQSRGRLDADQLGETVHSLEADFYLCGPVAWMASVSDALEQRGVSPERIHSESFGAAKSNTH